MSLLKGFIVTFNIDRTKISDEMLKQRAVDNTEWDEDTANVVPILHMKGKVPQLIDLIGYDASQPTMLIRYNASKIFQRIGKQLDDDAVAHLSEKLAGRIKKARKEAAYKDLSDKEIIAKILEVAVKPYDSKNPTDRFISGRMEHKRTDVEALEHVHNFDTLYRAAAVVREDCADEDSEFEEWLNSKGQPARTDIWLNKGTSYNMDGFTQANILKYWDQISAYLPEGFELKNYYNKPNMNIVGPAVLWVQKFNNKDREQYRCIWRAVHGVKLDLLSGGEGSDDELLEMMGGPGNELKLTNGETLKVGKPETKKPDSEPTKKEEENTGSFIEV